MFRIPFIAGNWKMFKTREEARAFASSFGKMYKEAGSDIKAAICAPYTQLADLVEAFEGSGVKVGAQNVHYEDEGAYTGEISIGMLKEIGVDYCIVGHSERRAYFNESDETVNLKLKKLLRESDIRPILCLGEGLEVRDAEGEERFVGTQLESALDGLSAEEVTGLVIAYEPIWAIGTGKTATPAQAGKMCSFIRNLVELLYDEDTADEVLILYGGSVKPENIGAIMNEEDIDGALVGGASLDPEKFMRIINF
jgi:triosephosphate isomerase